MISNFRWYRKLRGGYWVSHTGMMWGQNWMRLSSRGYWCAEEAWCDQCGCSIPDDRRSEQLTTCDVWCHNLKKVKEQPTRARDED